jgi:hypothetical protein
MAWPIGIDIAGTFTDAALVEDTSGSVGVAKVPIARFPIEIHAWLAGQVTEAFLGSAPTYLGRARRPVRDLGAYRRSGRSSYQIHQHRPASLSTPWVYKIVEIYEDHRA